MTISLPTPVTPTVVIPSPPNPNNPSFPAPLPPSAGFPLPVANYSILQALAQGILSPNTLVSSYTPQGGVAVSFANQLCPTLNSLMQSGQIPGNAPLSTLAFANPTNYGGT